MQNREAVMKPPYAGVTWPVTLRSAGAIGVP
jgi:hypothetical protein